MSIRARSVSVQSANEKKDIPFISLAICITITSFLVDLID